MAEPTTVVTCSYCGYPYPMTDLQREVYRGRTMGCMNCGRPFKVEPPALQPDPAPAPEAGAQGVNGFDGFDAAAAAAAPQSPFPTVPTGSGFTAPTVPGSPATVAAPSPADVTTTRKSNVPAGVSLGAGLLFFVLLAVTAITGYVTTSSGNAAAPGGESTFYTLVALSLAAGVAAIACGVVGYRRAGRPLTGGRGFAVAGLALGGGGGLVAACVLAVLLPAFARAREGARRERCRANLQQIGFALSNHTLATPGYRLPPTLDALVAAGGVSPDNLLCPGSGTPSAAPTATTPAATNPAAPPLPASYVYVVGGRQLTALSADTVLVHEQMGEHADGIHVLFADGTVVFCTRQQAAQLLSELAAGRNPPPAAQAVKQQQQPSGQ